MSVESVKLFYARLAIDEAFRTQVQNAQTKEECTQTVKDAGFDFTSQELEDYTAQILDLPDDLSELDKAELDSVLGGFSALAGGFPGHMQPLYGVIWPSSGPPQQMYGVVMPPDPIS
jgi:predicted ribosomally synthesized peptide with nif11-like leader